MASRDAHAQHRRPDREPQRRAQGDRLAINPRVHRRRGADLEMGRCPGAARTARFVVRGVEHENPELATVKSVS